MLGNFSVTDMILGLYCILLLLLYVNINIDFILESMFLLLSDQAGYVLANFDQLNLADRAWGKGG